MFHELARCLSGWYLFVNAPVAGPLGATWSIHCGHLFVSMPTQTGGVIRMIPLLDDDDRQGGGRRRNVNCYTTTTICRQRLVRGQNSVSYIEFSLSRRPPEAPSEIFLLNNNNNNNRASYLPQLCKCRSSASSSST